MRVERIRASAPLVTDKAVVAASVLMTKALAARLKAALEAVSEFDRQIERLCQTNLMSACTRPATRCLVSSAKAWAGACCAALARSYD